MSGVVLQPLQTDRHPSAPSKHGDTERHHSISDYNREGVAVTMDAANEPEIQETQTDISAGQKMLSAVSGSLLTSLLGEYLVLGWFLNTVSLMICAFQ